MNIWPSSKAGKRLLYAFMAVGVIGAVVKIFQWAPLVMPSVQGGKVAIVLEDSDLVAIESESRRLVLRGLALMTQLQTKRDELREWKKPERTKLAKLDAGKLAERLSKAPWFIAVEEFPALLEGIEEEWSRPVPFMFLERGAYENDPWEFRADVIELLLQDGEIDIAFMLWQRTAECIEELCKAASIHSFRSIVNISEFDQRAINALRKSAKLSSDQMKTIMRLLKIRETAVVAMPSQVIARDYVRVRYKLRSKFKDEGEAKIGLEKTRYMIGQPALELNRLLKSLADRYRALIVAFEEPVEGQLFEVLGGDQDFTQQSTQLRLKMSEEFRHEVEIDKLIPRMGYADKDYTRALCDLRLTRIALAIELYEFEKGELPVTLDNLVPHHISRILVNPFAGGTFEYSAQRRVLISKEPEWDRRANHKSADVHEFGF